VQQAQPVEVAAPAATVEMAVQGATVSAAKTVPVDKAALAALEEAELLARLAATVAQEG
jgi:hypothetical protein